MIIMDYQFHVNVKLIYFSNFRLHENQTILRWLLHFTPIRTDESQRDESPINQTILRFRF